MAGPVAAETPSPLAALVAGTTPAGPPLAGAVVVRVEDGRIVRREAAGFADIPAGRALRADTPMRVASISKLAVAVAVMRLVDEGRLDLDADVSRYLGFRFRNPAHPDAPVTLRHLLGHRSGISDAEGYRLPLGASLKDSFGPARWSGHAPGARFDYANLNFGVIATAMEGGTGERFDRLMARLVLHPLKLEACFNWSACPAGPRDRAAVLYRKGADETAWNPAGPWIAQVDAAGVRPAGGCPVMIAEGAACDLAAYRPGTNGTLFSPQGGLRISAEGLARLGRMLAGGGAIDGVRILKPETAARFFDSSPVGANAGETYGGAMREWGLIQCAPAGQLGPTRWCGHLGEAYGLYAGLWIDRAGKRVIAYALTGTADDPLKWPKGQSGLLAVEEALVAEALR